jgi:hypothetical protein
MNMEYEYEYGWDDFYLGKLCNSRVAYPAIIYSRLSLFGITTTPYIFSLPSSSRPPAFPSLRLCSCRSLVWLCFPSRSRVYIPLSGAGQVCLTTIHKRAHSPLSSFSLNSLIPPHEIGNPSPKTTFTHK